VDVWVYYIRALMDSRDRDAAISAVRRGRDAVADDEEGRLFLEWSSIMTRGGKRKAAANHAKNGWKRLAKQRSASVGDLLLGGERVVWTLHRDGDVKGAASIGRELTSLVPTHSDAWVIRANAELRTNRGSDAKASAEKAVELDDQSARAHDMRGQLWLRFGRKEPAKKEFERALELGKGTPQEKDFAKNLAAAQ
jgi:tetratricopeptide (TPR) repeat protein